jgi:hypothetical protein
VCYPWFMPKPAPRTVKLPDGGEIIPDHFHEGPEAARRFDQTVRDVLSVPHAEIERRHKEWERQRAKAKRRKVGA